MVDWSRYLKCDVCDVLKGARCETITGMWLNEDTGLFESVIVYADRPHSTRKRGASGAPSKPRAPRQPALPIEPVNPLAPKAAPKSKAAARRAASSQQRMVDSWLALARRKKTQ